MKRIPYLIFRRWRLFWRGVCGEEGCEEIAQGGWLMGHLCEYHADEWWREEMRKERQRKFEHEVRVQKEAIRQLIEEGHDVPIRYESPRGSDDASGGLPPADG